MSVRPPSSEAVRHGARHRPGPRPGHAPTRRHTEGRSLPSMQWPGRRDGLRRRTAAVRNVPRPAHADRPRSPPARPGRASRPHRGGRAAGRAALGLGITVRLGRDDGHLGRRRSRLARRRTRDRHAPGSSSVTPQPSPSASPCAYVLHGRLAHRQGVPHPRARPSPPARGACRDVAAWHLHVYGTPAPQGSKKAYVVRRARAG